MLTPLNPPKPQPFQACDLCLDDRPCIAARVCARELTAPELFEAPVIDLKPREPPG